jgi:hypothetical protein
VTLEKYLDNFKTKGHGEGCNRKIDNGASKANKGKKNGPNFFK